MGRVRITSDQAKSIEFQVYSCLVERLVTLSEELVRESLCVTCSLHVGCSVSCEAFNSMVVQQAKEECLAKALEN